MLTPYEQTLLECHRARRFLEESEYLEIDNTIAIAHNTTLHLYARKPEVVDWILANLETVKRDAWIICGAETIGVFCYGETIDEFCTRDILVSNADVTFATSPMTTALETPTLELPAIDNAPVSAPVDAPTAANVTKLFTIAELIEIAEEAGLGGNAIAEEIRAISPKLYHWHGEDLYPIEAADAAIDRLKDEAKERLRSVATQPRTMPPAEPPAAKARVAAKKKSTRKPTVKKSAETVA